MLIINRPRHGTGFLPPQPGSLFGLSQIVEIKPAKEGVKVGRNELCPCGSKIKSKSCPRRIKHFMDKCLSNVVWWMIAPFCYFAYLSGQRSKKKIKIRERDKV